MKGKLARGECVPQEHGTRHQERLLAHDAVGELRDL